MGIGKLGVGHTQIFKRYALFDFLVLVDSFITSKCKFGLFMLN